MPSLLINKRQKITTVTRLAGKQLKVMAVWSNTLKSSHSLIEHPEIFSDMEWLNKTAVAEVPFCILVKFCKEFVTLKIAG